MKVMVAGGSGFVGSRLIPALQEQGHEVGVYDLVVNPRFASFTEQGDVRDTDHYSFACAGYDAIVNLAAAHRDDVRPIELYQQTNVDGATNTVRALIDNRIDRLVFTSTVAVYGLDKEASRETDEPDPFNEYGRTKLAAEAIYRAWQADAQQERNLFTVRPCVIFGEGNRGNVYTLAKQLSGGFFLTIGDGHNHKSMAYVGNVVAFLIGQLEHNTGSTLMNYADKPDLTTNELVTVLRAALNKHRGQSIHLPLGLGVIGGKAFDLMAKLLHRNLPISEVRIRKFAASTVVNTDKLEASGFQRPFTIEEGLHRTVRAEFGVDFQASDGDEPTSS